MTTSDALHPSHLRVGDKVGPWLIVKVLGRGGYGRVFRVERNGHAYTLKISLMPLASQPGPDEEDPRQRMGREVAAMMTSTPHPNLLRVHAVDCWPHPDKGYPYFVTDAIDADDWNVWRWKHNPHAGHMVDTYRDLVRLTADLHRRGLYHRELKAEHVLIRREDGRPFLIDFGSVRMPGARTITTGLPPGVLHLLPPEALDFLERKLDEPDARFEGGVAGDLYALGILLYQALTDCYPFSSALTDQQIVVAILTVVPTAPHLLNPRAPRSLSDIAMRLLEKRPEDRYADTAELLRALEDAATAERESETWTQPLLSPELLEPRGEEEPPPPPVQAPPPVEATPAKARRPVWRGERRKHRGPLLASLGMVALLLLGGLTLRATMSSFHTHSKGTPLVPSDAQDSLTSSRDTSWWSVFLVWLCTSAGWGCASAPVHPSPPANDPCPPEALHAMYKVLGIKRGDTMAHLDIQQPGEATDGGVYRTGPIISRVRSGKYDDPAIPTGTLLFGYLWTNGYQLPNGAPVARVIYTELLLPDENDKLPVCMVIGHPLDGWWGLAKGSTPNSAILNRLVPVYAVKKWPSWPPTHLP